MTEHTVYLEVKHEWTGEHTYHAETIPATLTLADWTEQVWWEEGYTQHTHRTVKSADIGR